MSVFSPPSKYFQRNFKLIYLIRWGRGRYICQRKSWRIHERWTNTINLTWAPLLIEVVAKLKGSRWDNDESIAAAMKNFEMGAKRMVSFLKSLSFFNREHRRVEDHSVVRQYRCLYTYQAWWEPEWPSSRCSAGKAQDFSVSYSTLNKVSPSIR